MDCRSLTLIMSLNKPLGKIYMPSHRSKKGNEVVADLIAREIPMLVNGQSNH